MSTLLTSRTLGGLEVVGVCPYPPPVLEQVGISSLTGTSKEMKHLVDLDETALTRARAELGTTGIK